MAALLAALNSDDEAVQSAVRQLVVLMGLADIHSVTDEMEHFKKGKEILDEIMEAGQILLNEHMRLKNRCNEPLVPNWLTNFNLTAVKAIINAKKKGNL